MHLLNGRDFHIDGKRFRAAIAAAALCASLVPAGALAQSRDFVQFEKAKTYFRQGMIYYNNMQYVAAAELFRKAVEIYDDYHTARDYLGRSYRLAGMNDAALKEWENLLSVSPDNPSIVGKVEAVRFHDSAKGDSGFTDLVHYAAYNSSKMRRFRFEKPVDIVVDAEKNSYITSFSGGKLVKLNANGEGIFSVKMSTGGMLYGVDCRVNTLAVTDFKNNRFYLLDSKTGRVKKEIGEGGSGEGRFHGPEGICFDDRGDIYVADSGNDRIQKFTPSGAFILQCGERGDYDGQLRGPSDVAVLDRVMYVVDSGNSRIVSFDDSGNYRKKIEIEGLEAPRSISRGGPDTLLIADEKKGLCIYHPSDGFTQWLDSWNDGRKKFSRLVAAVRDRDEYLYCVDFNRDSIQLFSPAGKRYSNLLVEIASVDVKKYPLVAFYLNIRGRDGKPIYGLDSANFTVIEDGARPVRIYTGYLKDMAPSVSITLCVDRSLEAKRHEAEVPWATDFVLSKIRKNDSVKVLNFHGEFWSAGKFDWSSRRTKKLLGGKDYGQGKDFGGVIYNAISDLAPRLNRRAVMVVTDGSVAEDSFRKYSARNVIDYARAHYIPVYFLSFGKPDKVISSIARETGGRVYLPTELDSLRAFYDRVKRSEEYRYVVVYSTFKPSSFKGWWSDVKIEVDQKGQKGTEWGGYFVP